MKNKLFKNIAAIAFFMFLFSVMAVPMVYAQPELGMNYAGNLNLTEANETDPKEMAVSIVRYLMTFLGIIAVVIILYGGFIWMTAAGNEDKMDKAKKMIIAGAIGLVVILCAYAIVNFVISMTNDTLTGNI